MRRPPRLAEWLLTRRIWPDEHTIVLGDLEEQFQERVRTSGALHGTLWYWREAFRLAWGIWWWTPRAARQRSAVIAMDDLRYAIRRLLRQPLTSVVSVLTLACAIGAAAATWSLVSAVLLHPLDVREPERLVQIGFRNERPRGPRVTYGHTYPAYQRLRDAGLMHVVASGWIAWRTPLVIEGAGEERARSVIFASHDFLDLLGLQPSLGRFFTESEDRRGAPLVAVLSHRLWRRELNADPAVIGRIIRLRDRPVEIVGVAPEGFDGLELGRAPDLFMPLHAIDQIQPYEGLYSDRPPTSWVEPVGRLPDGVTLTQMQERLNGLQLDPARGRTSVLTEVLTAAIPESSRDGVRHFSRLLGSTVALLLAIGSLTVGMLLVMRTEARSGELAMCLALGASRARLAAGLAMESVLLAATSALLAVPVSRLLFAGIRAFELPGGIDVELLELSIDGRLLAAIAAAAVASVVVMAGLASLIGVRRQLGDVLRSQAGATPRLTRRRSRSALVTAQVAVTLVLVTGAGLFARSVTRALSLNPGIDTSGLVRLSRQLDLEAYGYDVVRGGATFEELRERLAHHPAIASVAFSQTPSASSDHGTVRVDGEPLELPVTTLYEGIDDRYLGTIGLPIIAGRSFTATDRFGATPVAIVSASLARLIAGDASPIGLRIEEPGQAGASPGPIEIVGVVPDVLWSANPSWSLRVYLPIAQMAASSRQILIFRAAGDVGVAMRAATAAVRALEPEIRVLPMTTIDATILEQMGPQRFGMTVMGALGAIALFLSVLGTYVLAETMATLRQREIGIRAALGARGPHLRALLLQDTLRLVGTGLLVGFFLSWLGADTIRAFLFQVEPFDPLVTGGVAVTIVVLALVVSLRPAFAATRLDLARVLREG